MIETELKNWNTFNKFVQFIGLTYFYHFKKCQNNNCVNCNFINKVIDICIDNFEAEENGTEILKKICREWFGHFFSLATLIKNLKIIEEKKLTY